VRSIPVVIEPAAKQDIRAIRDCYSDKGIGTSERFRDELSRNFELFSRYPEGVSIAFGRTRLKSMKDFPYVIGYVFLDGIVHVTGIQHGGLGWSEFELRQF
jgi:plasmid stabilization system protein ParE